MSDVLFHRETRVEVVERVLYRRNPEHYRGELGRLRLHDDATHVIEALWDARPCKCTQTRICSVCVAAYAEVHAGVNR